MTLGFTAAGLCRRAMSQNAPASPVFNDNKIEIFKLPGEMLGLNLLKLLFQDFKLAVYTWKHYNVANQKYLDQWERESQFLHSDVNEISVFTNT